MADLGVVSGPLTLAAVSSFLAADVVIAGVTIGTVGGLAFTTALTGASYLLSRSAAQRGRGGLTAELDKQIVKQALPVARAIYGRALVGGSLFFFEREGDWLYYGIVLCNHEIDAVEEIRMGDRLVTVNPATGAATSVPYFNGTSTYLHASIRTGADAQVIDPILAADFPALATTFRQRGCATVVLKMYQPLSISTELNRELYGNSGQPAPLFMVRGKKVFDPRDAAQSSSDPATWKWSETPSLCAADFQTMPRSQGGGGTDWSEIDLAALRSAANDDDAPVATKAGVNEKRYTLNGVIMLDGTAASETVQRMLTANAGTRVTSNGTFKFLSGVARAPVWTFNDDSARGAMNVVLQAPLESRVNIVTTAFVSSAREYQSAEGPELRDAAYITEDGAEMPSSLDLPFTNSASMAQRIANIVMQESRHARRVTRREDLASLLCDAADVVNLESGAVPSANGKYIIEAIESTDNPLEFDVTLRGYDPAVYAWDAATQEQDFTVSPADLN